MQLPIDLLRLSANFSVYEWNGFFVPKGTPADVVQKLEEMVRTALARPEVKEKLASMGLTPMGSTSQAFADFLESEEQRWSEVIKANSISLN